MFATSGDPFPGSGFQNVLFIPRKFITSGDPIPEKKEGKKKRYRRSKGERKKGRKEQKVKGERNN